VLELNYDVAGATRPAEEDWADRPGGYRAFERTVPLGAGDKRWASATRAVMSWQVKTRSGFAVEPVDGDLRARRGAAYVLTARIGPVAVREPVRVVAVVTRPDRCGFSYGTRHGHPVSGEEAFVVHRSADGRVWLTLRSLTRPAPGGAWRWVFPVLLIAQRYYRRRYLRALRKTPD
jgi:uncharacterized protein (UPF0548 family)